MDVCYMHVMYVQTRTEREGPPRSPVMGAMVKEMARKARAVIPVLCCRVVCARTLCMLNADYLLHGVEPRWDGNRTWACALFRSFLSGLSPPVMQIDPPENQVSLTLGVLRTIRSVLRQILATRPRDSGTRAWHTISFRLVPHSSHSASSALSLHMLLLVDPSPGLATAPVS